MKTLINIASNEDDYKQVKKIFSIGPPEKLEDIRRMMLNELEEAEEERKTKTEYIKQKFNLNTSGLNEIAGFVINTWYDDKKTHWIKNCLFIFKIYDSNPVKFDLSSALALLHEENARMHEEIERQEFISEFGNDDDFLYLPF